MNSRMDKYETLDNTLEKSRTSKNKKLYDEVSKIDIGYIDISKTNVLTIPKENNNRGRTREEYQKVKGYEGIISKQPQKEEILTKEEMPQEKIYDIDEILKRAKETLKEDESKKRLINTEYNILTKLDIDKINNVEELKEDELKQLVYDAYPKKEKKDDELDLFADLKSSLEETVKDMKEVEEIVNTKVEDVNLKDDVLNETTKEVIKKEEVKEIKKVKPISEDELTSETELIELERKSRAMIIFIIIIVLVLLGGGAYLLLDYFKIL